MNENTRTRQMLTRVRERYPHAVAMKLNDRTTGGLPDAVITLSGRSLWVESKRGRLTLTPIQRRTLAKLHAASDGRALAVVFEPTRYPHYAHLFTVTDAGTSAPTAVQDLDALVDELIIRLEMGDVR
jgi:hypothetical protein